MTRTTIEDDLAAWLQSGPTEAPAVLLTEIVRAVPTLGQRRGRRRFAWPGSSMLGVAQAVATLALMVVVIGAGIVALGNRPGDSGVQPPPSGPAAPSAAPASPEASASSVAIEPTTSPAGVAVASATPAAPAATQPQPGPVACGPTTVRTRITAWDGAMGQRIATVELTNTSLAPCTIRALSGPQLVDAGGRILIDSAAAAPSVTLTVQPGGKLRTLVEDSNYCGPAPTAPVTLAFVLGAGDRIVASPLTRTDVTLPPCNGSAVPSSIQMQHWAR
jgi:hypothetical protein